MDKDRDMGKNVNHYSMGMIPLRPYNINGMHDLQEFYDVMKTKEGVDLPVSGDVSVLKRKITVGKKIIPNAMAVHPSEGWDGDENGNPTDTVFERYAGYARGGSGLIWFESFGIARDGKDGPFQLMMERDNIKTVSKLLQKTDQAAIERFGQEHKPYKIIQLNHSGRRSVDSDWNPAPITGCYNPYFDMEQRGNIVVADDAYIEQVVEKYVDAAYNALEAGFDGVDMKICHGYFLSDLMSAFMREGKYGGSFENRIRAILEIVDGIKKRCGNAIDICVRMNAYDAIPYPNGWGMVKKPGIMEPDLAEPKQLLKILADKGVKIANISTTDSRFEPYGHGAFAKTRKIAPDPYVGTYHLLKATKELREAVPELLYVGTGLSWFEKYCGNVGAGGIKQGWFDIAGYGRQAIVYPGYAADLCEKGSLDVDKLCMLCDKCHELSMTGRTKVGCVIRILIYNYTENML